MMKELKQLCLEYLQTEMKNLFKKAYRLNEMDQKEHERLNQKYDPKGTLEIPFD